MPTSAAKSEALFLCTAIADERAQNESIGYCGRCKDLERGEERTELLIRVPDYDTLNAVDSDSHEDEGKGEQEDEGDFPGGLSASSQAKRIVGVLTA